MRTDREWWGGDMERFEGIGSGEMGLGEVRRGVEIGRSGKGQGAVGRDRERWGRTRSSGEGQGEVGRDRERQEGTGSSGERQGAVWRNMERFKGTGSGEKG